MYRIVKQMEVSSSHCLSLPYSSKCANPHGHNWLIEVHVSGLELNSYGMLIDFSHISQVVNKLDHVVLNNVLMDGDKPINPTAENIARWIARNIQKLCGEHIYVDKVVVKECEGNTAIWEL